MFRGSDLRRGRVRPLDCLCRDRRGGGGKKGPVSGGGASGGAGSSYWGQTESGSQDWSAQEVGTRPGRKT